MKIVFKDEQRIDRLATNFIYRTLRPLVNNQLRFGNQQTSFNYLSIIRDTWLDILIKMIARPFIIYSASSGTVWVPAYIGCGNWKTEFRFDRDQAVPFWFNWRIDSTIDPGESRLPVSQPGRCQLATDRISVAPTNARHAVSGLHVRCHRDIAPRVAVSRETKVPSDRKTIFRMFTSGTILRRASWPGREREMVDELPIAVGHGPSFRIYKWLPSFVILLQAL